MSASGGWEKKRLQMIETQLPEVDPPSLGLLLAEVRAIGEWLSFPLRTRSLHGLPRSDGHALMVLPGFGTGDGATHALQRVLTRLGYIAHGWAQGRNLGMNSQLWDSLLRRLRALAAQHGPISLIGWSLGGVFARELARREPARVRAVFTLGSPINGRPDANNVHALLRRFNRSRITASDLDAFERRRTPPPVPCTAIYSRRDGVVDWRCCLEPECAQTENVEVQGSHLGLVFNPQVLAILAERLPRPWRTPPVDQAR